MKVKLTKWLCIATGEEYYSEQIPTEKMIGDEKFIEITQNFKSAHFIKFDSLKKNGTITKELHVS